MADRANFLAISTFVYIYIIFNHLLSFSAVVLSFHSFSYSLYFLEKWYHWYHPFLFAPLTGVAVRKTAVWEITQVTQSSSAARQDCLPGCDFAGPALLCPRFRGDLLLSGNSQYPGMLSRRP